MPLALDRAFPHSQFPGVDLDRASIDAVPSSATAEGLSDGVRFHVGALGELEAATGFGHFQAFAIKNQLDLFYSVRHWHRAHLNENCIKVLSSIMAYLAAHNPREDNSQMTIDSDALPLEQLMWRLDIDSDRLARDFECLMAGAERRCIQCKRWDRCNVLLDSKAPVHMILDQCPNFRMLEAFSSRPITPH